MQRATTTQSLVDANERWSAAYGSASAERSRVVAFAERLVCGTIDAADATEADADDADDADDATAAVSRPDDWAALLAFRLRDPAPAELWSPQHTPLHEGTAALVLRGVLSAAEIQMLLTAPGPCYPPRTHKMLRGTNTGPAAVHDVALSDDHKLLFLHRGHHFQTAWPELCARLIALMGAQPGFPCEGEAAADDLRLRCAELHTYTAGGGLLAPGHRDRGSVLSLAILLSDPAACEGGQFVTWGSGQQPLYHPLGAGDAILFHSEKTHNVTTVRSGERVSLVLELWRGEANKYDRVR